jgi:shikimate kinase
MQSRMKPSVLILIGFRGTGKSTLAERLATTLGWGRISTDERVTAGIIADGVGNSIAHLVEGKGWSAFRERERAFVMSLTLATIPNNTVIDCGGGMVENDEAMRRLAEYGVIIWVHAELDDVLHRLALDANTAQRPALSHTDWQTDTRHNFVRRLPMYEQYAEYRVSTSDTGVDACVSAIVLQFGLAPLPSSTPFL